MEIIYLGHSGFLLKYKSARVVCDPFSESVGFKLGKITADIATVSHNHEDHNNLSMVDGDLVVINGPGEYEVKGVAVTGLSSFHDEKAGQDRGKNVIYVFQAEDLRVCHLGDLGHELSEKQVNVLGDIDILLVPVGGVYTLDSTKAVKVVKQINPSIVVPMHFKTKSHNQSFDKCSPLSDFVEAIQLEATKMDKLSIKNLELPEELALVVLKRYEK